MNIWQRSAFIKTFELMHRNFRVCAKFNVDCNIRVNDEGLAIRFRRRSIRSFNILPRKTPGNSPGILFLKIGLLKFPPLGAKILFNCPIWNTGVDSHFFCKKRKKQRRTIFRVKVNSLPLNTCIFKIKTPCILTGKTWHFRFKFPTPAKLRLTEGLEHSFFCDSGLKCIWHCVKIVRRIAHRSLWGVRD